MTERAHDPYRPQTVPTLTDIVQAQPASDGSGAAHDAQPPADAGLRAAAPADIPADMPVPLAQIPTLMPEPQPDVALRTSRYIERALNAVGGAASVADAAPPSQPSQSLQPEPSAGPDASAWQGAFDDLQPLPPPRCECAARPAGWRAAARRRSPRPAHAGAATARCSQ